MAALEEFLQQKYVEYYDDTDKYVNKVELLSNKLTDLLLTNSDSRKYIIYEGKTHYLLNKKSLPDEIKENLVGGDSDKTEDFSKLIDVYGITTDLHVYYINTSDGTQYGNMNVEDVNPDLYMPKINSDNAMNSVVREALKEVGVEIDEEKGITIDNVSKISKLTIDGTKNSVTNIEAISELLNLQELTLKNLTLDNLTGIETLGMLNYIYFDNCKINDYSKMANVLKLTYLYFYFPTTMSEEEANSQITNLGNGMKNATRIDGLQYLYLLGNKSAIYSVESQWSWQQGDGKIWKYSNSTLSNLTDISGLKKLPSNIKESVIELYLNNHKIKDISCLSGFKGLQNVIMPCNPELHSLVGLENKKDLLYLAAQQPSIYDDSGNLKKDIGISDLNGLVGCEKLINLVLFCNTNLTDVSGISSSKDLERIMAQHCGIISSKGFDGNEGEGLDSLVYLNLEYNNELKNVLDIGKCDGITGLFMEGCLNMIDEEAISLEKIIKRCGSYYSFPYKYTLGFSDVSSFSVSGVDFKDNDLENLRNRVNIESLKLDGCSSLSDSNLRSVLNTMSGLKYLWLRGCINLSSIDFVDSMSLVQLNIAETNVADLSYLNDESSIDLASLFVKSTKINDYQFLLKNLCNNAGKWHEGNEDKNGKYNFTRESDPKFLGSTWYYSSLGLILQNSGMTINVPSDVSYFTVGASCANNTWNLSSCSKLKHIMLGGPSGHFILPENIDNLFFDFLGSPTYDFSKCKNLKFITFWYGDFDTRIGDSLETLPDENKLEYLELARCKITNLSFLNKFNTSKLKTLIVRGWNTAVSNKMTTLISSNGLESATNVTYLCIRNTSITGCDNINALENLQTLDLSYNNIGSVSFLSDLVTVTNANLGYNVFSQLPDLSKLNSLNTLSIFGCSNVTDLGPLESLIRDGTTLLRTLNLQDCTGLESVSSSNGYNNEDLIDRLKKAGCTNIITTGTRL